MLYSVEDDLFEKKIDLSSWINSTSHLLKSHPKHRDKQPGNITETGPDTIIRSHGERRWERCLLSSLYMRRKIYYAKKSFSYIFYHPHSLWQRNQKPCHTLFLFSSFYLVVLQGKTTTKTNKRVMSYLLLNSTNIVSQICLSFSSGDFNFHIFLVYSVAISH